MSYMVDNAKIYVEAGHGGSGSDSFKREKYIPRGGPDGGDGGDGGNVYFIGDHNMATLLDFRSKPKYKAENGEAGRGKKMFGKDGKDLFIRVPLGTLIYEIVDNTGNDGFRYTTKNETNRNESLGENSDSTRVSNKDTLNTSDNSSNSSKSAQLVQAPQSTQSAHPAKTSTQNKSRRLLADIVEHDVPVLIAKGGRGGLGNVHFKSSTNQAPTQFTPGTKGQAKDLHLEVKMVADVGLVGLPNAGKSTLVNSLTGSNAKIGAYPFTTIFPNLGPLELPDGNKIIIADIPGLIEGASEGKGLGDDFLRHIERTRILVHMIDPTSYGTTYLEDFSDTAILVENTIRNYTVIRKELEDFQGSLESKPEVVVINKIDVTEVREAFDSIKDGLLNSVSKNLIILGISAFTGEGLEELKVSLMNALEDVPERSNFGSTEEVIKVYTLDNIPNKRMIQRV